MLANCLTIFYGICVKIDLLLSVILSTRGLFVGRIGAQVPGETSVEKVRQEGIFGGIGKERKGL